MTKGSSIVTKGMLCCLHAVVVAIALGAVPGKAYGQHCRRSCQPGEGRDARGCCIPAKEEPKKQRGPQRPAARSKDAGEKAETGGDREERGASSEKTRREANRRLPRERAQEPARKRTRTRTEEPAKVAPVVQPTAPGGQMQVTESVPEPEEPDRESVGALPTAPGKVDAQPASEQVEHLLSGPPGLLSAGGPRDAPKRRWAAWMPWAVMGAGAAVTSMGGVLYWRASANYADFDRDFNALCEQRGGCRESEVPDLSERLDRAERQEQAAKVSFVAGGAVVAAGLVMVLLNRPQPEREKRGGLTDLSLIPMMSPNGTGMAACISF